MKFYHTKIQCLPFFVFVNNFVKVRQQCDVVWDGLSSLLLSLSPPSKRKCPMCNGIKIGLGPLSESSHNLSLLEPPPRPMHLILYTFFYSVLSSVLPFLSWSSVLCMQVGCLGSEFVQTLQRSIPYCLIEKFTQTGAVYLSTSGVSCFVFLNRLSANLTTFNRCTKSR